MLRDETRYQDARSLEFPEGVKRHALSGCGLAVTLPERFLPLPEPFDPLAQCMEETWAKLAVRESGPRPDRRQGFYDPAVYRIFRGAFCPMRTLEFVVRRWAESDDVQRTTRALRRLVPEALDKLELPGCWIGRREDMLVGGAPALRFEYVWDGPGERVSGGDHALAVVLPLRDRVTYVFHHCPGDHWRAWEDGLEHIFASLSLTGFEGVASRESA